MEDDEFEEDEGIQDEDEEIEEGVSPIVSAVEFQVIAPDQIRDKQEEIKAQVADVLGLPPDLCQMLLIQFQWNKELLLEKFMDNPEKVQAEAGVIVAPPPPLPAKFECDICCCEFRRADGIALNCGHLFCRECVRGHLENAVSQGPTCISTPCPHSGCPAKYPEPIFASVLGTGKFLEKYNEFLRHSFVEGSHDMKWCPAPGCSFACISTGGGTACKCRCGHLFCFRCAAEAHAPATCDMVEKWTMKCNDEREDLTWITGNTKQCPKCHIPIEKNQGCNHMTCSRCRHEFCWMCRGPWTEHGSETGGYYKCNKYDPKKHDDPYAVDAKNQLTYYVHYFERYTGHQQSQKFASGQLKKAQEKMVELQSRPGYDSQRAAFILQAVEQVIECRRVLKWTYVFGYYLKDGPEKNLFEFLQRDLERTTEHLSELSEAPVEQIDRMELVNYSTATRKFLHNLMVGIENGLSR
ncbi:putative E3 ubiquitin-protein ligase dbl4 [Paratrimastix pyriformis]|uniref:RBR-type E3 ubiquitin transferase n=1 Tax=Paratrimastix pyriformis TaxID=342808 RepID=A0ABQ8UBV6_9EUKA|nr:putative E3 ubiquitin-protein ligase dbl4 [Paratrimastix pyriformis]|eukprot:GAFH01001449.1.p1 GENE.GAFH01001449.1~~GAFH01001449.1.p1  ORF type:complete len:486 (-),score=64.43 GAFH01001449.1:162-1559(-)